MKNLIIAILIGLILSYSVGNVFQHWFDWHLYIDGHHVNTLAVIGWGSVGVVFLVALSFIVALSIFGALSIVMLAVVMSLIVVGISTMWPILLLVLLVVMLSKGKRAKQHYQY